MKKEKNSLDIVALWVSIISIFLSIGTLAFSIYVFQFERIERLDVNASLVGGRDEIWCQGFRGSMNIIQIPAKVVISNNGDKALSIVAYDVIAISSKGNSSWYSGIDGGVTDSEGKPIEMPFKLEPGESRHIEIRLGLWLEHSAELVLQKSGINKGCITRRQLMIALGRESIDIYGNKVSLKEYPDGNIILHGPGLDKKDQTFIIKIHTGRHSIFEAKTSFYPI